MRALAWYDRIGLAHLGRRLSWRLHFADLVHHLRAVAQYRRLGVLRRGGALSRLFDQGPRHGRSRPARRVLLVHLLSRHGAARRPRSRLSSRRSSSAGPTRRTGSGAIDRPRHARRGRALYGGLALSFSPAQDRQVSNSSIPARRSPRASFCAAPLELLGAAGIIYFALPAAGNPGFFIVLGIFLASFSIALVSHAPGGLGVLEFAFVKAMPDTPRADLVAALLVVPAALSDHAAGFRAGRRRAVRAPADRRELIRAKV